MATRTAAQKFETNVKKIERQIAKLASGTDPDSRMALYRAIDRLDDSIRSAAPTCPNECYPEMLAIEIMYGLLTGLRRAARAACEQAALNRTEARQVEIRALLEVHNLRNMGGFERELRLAVPLDLARIFPVDLSSDPLANQLKRAKVIR